MAKRSRDRVAAIDLFCGAGGLTRGLLDAGVKVVAGYDIDADCRFAYEENNSGVRFRNESVSSLTARELARLYPKRHTRILVGCAPCQTFSKYTQGLRQAGDPKWKLLTEFGRLVRELKPDVVSMENVPELADYKIFYKFLSVLANEGYYFTQDPEKWIVFCPDYGVPQNRRRLVILASRLGPIELIPPTHDPEEYLQVKDAIRKLPRLRAGEVCKADPLHRSSNLSERNLKRIRASKPGGSWRDWPVRLRADCHKGKSGKSYPSVYGRMEWDKPSPTITTQFYGYGSGRFGHPNQNRGLSLREGAILQSFPSWYQFVEPGTEYSFKGVGRLIGNAVPVRLGLAIGQTIRKHVKEYEE
jgi:DNA (cytosine-5)-methyltransferase 1